jgi:hypothetical protein
MLETFESLPFGITTLIVAAISLGLVALSALVVPARRLWLAACLLPLLIAWTIYWIPYWARPHADSAEYDAWLMLFLFAWGGAGILVSLLFVALLARYRKRAARMSNQRLERP